MVLMIYRTLAEDLFLYEEAVADARKAELLTALTSVIVSAPILESLYAKADPNQISGKMDLIILLNLVRANPSNKGWLWKWIDNLREFSQAWSEVLSKICFIHTEVCRGRKRPRFSVEHSCSVLGLVFDSSSVGN